MRCGAVQCTITCGAVMLFCGQFWFGLCGLVNTPRCVCDLLIEEAGCFEQCKSIERSWSDLLLANSSSIIQSASYLIFIGSLSFRLVGCS